MKQFFLPLSEPAGAVCALLLVQVAWLLWKRKTRVALVLSVPAALLLLLGNTAFVNAVVAAAEQGTFRQASGRPQAAAPFDVVLVLGGGVNPSDHDPHGFAFESGASRVLKGLSLVQDGRATNLVLGGSIMIKGEQRPASERVQDWITALGYNGLAMTNLGYCANTHEEALAFRTLQLERGWHSVALVTSALHMPRSAAVFQKQGVNVVPVPCDFKAFGAARPPFSIFPFQRNLDLMSAYLHEKIGAAVYHLRGWT